ncbi:hypothetical protein PENTCL1PPCAC_2126, partial [Pristionchus entomophagus]
LQPNQSNRMCNCLCTLFLLIIAIFLPPLAVVLHMGCNNDACINVLLSLLGWIPGIIHAWYVILAKDPRDSYAPATVVNIHHQGAPLYNM